MPGGFTHIAVVRSLGIDYVLRRIEGMPRDIRRSIEESRPFLELGSVSPDLPYMAFFAEDADSWADALHHEKTADTLRIGIKHLLAGNGLDGERREEITAWLFGYAAHLVPDMISHPVVRLRVGEYEHHKREHRVCELSQDKYIFQTKLDTDLCASESLDRGVRACTGSGQPGRDLAPHLADFWTGILQEVYPEKANADPAAWFEQFGTNYDSVADEGKTFTILRGALEMAGLLLPREPDMSYIIDIPAPHGQTVSYDQLFDRMLVEVKRVWGEMAQAITSGNPDLVGLPNGDLDSGEDLDGDHASVFWPKEGDFA